MSDGDTREYTKRTVEMKIYVYDETEIDAVHEAADAFAEELAANEYVMVDVQRTESATFKGDRNE